MSEDFDDKPLRSVTKHWSIVRVVNSNNINDLIPCWRYCSVYKLTLDSRLIGPNICGDYLGFIPMNLAQGPIGCNVALWEGDPHCVVDCICASCSEFESVSRGPTDEETAQWLYCWVHQTHCQRVWNWRVSENHSSEFLFTRRDKSVIHETDRKVWWHVVNCRVLRSLHMNLDLFVADMTHFQY